MSTAEPEANPEFLTEFLDDYFAECDEHLTVARRNLLALDHFVGQPAIDSSTLDELLRCFHSLKGISGMVGVREAEHLAHQIESYLRALRDGSSRLTAEGIDALIAGVKAMEQLVAERRQSIPATDLEPVLTRLSAIAESSGAGPRPASAPMTASRVQELKAAENIRLAVQAGKKIWRFEFTPVPELADRGINVNVVRARLNEIGELIQAAPRVMPSGGIAFEFVVSSNADESAFAGWREDGLTWTLHEAPSATLAEKEASPRSSDQSKLPVSHGVSSPTYANVVRVDLARLDDLMRMVAGLVISRSRLDDNLKRVEGELPASGWRPLQETNLAMERQLRDLRQGVMRVRMVPVGEIFERMQFVVRDLARQYQKRVKLELSGQQTEIDKLLVERMMDPILHLVRNAVSHGLEPPDERVAEGKDPEGRLSLRAYAQAEMVVIEVEDDGLGIDADRVARRGRAAGLIGSESALDASTLLDLICAPGFSTREEADRTSGRGVGMNVVKNTILGLGGSFDLNTEPGRGTLFTIQLPLTVAIADALIVSSGDQRFAVPQSSVREVIEVESSQVKALENNEIISYRGGVLPLVRLSRLFRTSATNGDRFHAFVVGSGLNSVGVAIDRILGQREIVVRAISDPLIQVAGVAGATELGDGRIVLILDAAALARVARSAAPLCSGAEGAR